MLSRINHSVLDFLFFQPGEYAITANVHVWPTPPQLTNGTVQNTGESFTLSQPELVYFEASQWVLVVGAIAGGLLCFGLLLLYRLRNRSLASIGGMRALVFGAAMAILLCSIGTVLISRLSGTDFLVSVRVRDIWGAVATGFVIQWFGVSYVLSKLAPSKADTKAPPKTGAAAALEREQRGERTQDSSA